jgi:hypothetical protein
VKKSKTYFEQIPVEVVKKMVNEHPEKTEEGETRNRRRGLNTPNGNTEPASRTGEFAYRKGV